MPFLGAVCWPMDKDNEPSPVFLLARAIPRALKDLVWVPNRAYVSGVNDLDETPFGYPGFPPGSYFVYPLTEWRCCQFLNASVRHRCFGTRTSTVSRSRFRLPPIERKGCCRRRCVGDPLGIPARRFSLEREYSSPGPHRHRRTNGRSRNGRVHA